MASVLGVSGCEGPPASSAEEADDATGALRGELAVYVADIPDVGSRTEYFLRDAAGNERKLLFSSAPQPEMVSGVRLKLRGVESPDGLQVTDYQILPSNLVDTARSALIGGAPYPVRKFAFILIDIGGGFTPVRYMGQNNVAVTSDLINKRMIADADSIKNYYLYDSYGRQDITNVVIGPVTYTPNACDTSAMSRALKAQVDAQGGPFDHYLWYYGSNNSSCSWSGLASVGSPQTPQKDTWYNASVSCVVLVQEPGHNFGMQHSSSLKCSGATYADDPNTCTGSEYGDSYDPMGGGCRHMNAWQKTYQGWTGGCNGVRVQASGSFTLLPLEPQCNGVQFLQIKSPKTRTFNRPAAGGGGASTETFDYYYVELRAPQDFDGTLAYGSSAMTQRVLLHVATAPRTRTQTGLHTFILDMNPSTTTLDGFTEGQTFADPAGGLTITARNITTSSATIDVTYTNNTGAGPTCLDNSAFTPPGPSTCGGTGTGGMGGTGGAGGAGGAGGTTGTAGRGGTTGTAGMGGTTGTAGRGGTTGTAGMGGTTGTAGRGGTTGTGGAGGSTAGMAGTTGAGGRGGTTGGGGAAGMGVAGNAGGGTTGTAGTGVSTGTGGSGVTTGTAGSGIVTTGSGGSIVTTGTAGSGVTTGTAGSSVISGVAGANGGQGGGKPPGEISGGCNCEVGGGGGPSSGFVAMLALACVAIGRTRSRSGRAGIRTQQRRQEDGR